MMTLCFHMSNLTPRPVPFILPSLSASSTLHSLQQPVLQTSVTDPCSLERDTVFYIVQEVSHFLISAGTLMPKVQQLSAHQPYGHLKTCGRCYAFHQQGIHVCDDFSKMYFSSSSFHILSHYFQFNPYLLKEDIFDILLFGTSLVPFKQGPLGDSVYHTYQTSEKEC